ncbi:hypothetical protein [Lederbergia lenta]|uniref:hypothetical protein n=1 Tax=Lederbergia lenta TaxID=1467 RepID=UPI00203FDF9B|nr:hypothetical protein [Lederbergia lenta]MCM3109885.1 hypothetical protein [Lederbergia lenta]
MIYIYLLTYIDDSRLSTRTFKWFSSIEELKGFARMSYIHPINAFYIDGTEEIDWRS